MKRMENGLTPHQWHVLWAVQFGLIHNGLSARRRQRCRLGVSPIHKTPVFLIDEERMIGDTNVTSTIRCLAKAGMLERHPGNPDWVQLELTDKGRQAL